LGELALAHDHFLFFSFFFFFFALTLFNPRARAFSSERSSRSAETEWDDKKKKLCRPFNLTRAGGACVDRERKKIEKKKKRKYRNPKK
jgi:hypothetical protein